ncbi:STE24 endopeptidase [Saccharothrix tamanrassetensis]|uniref:STE24 endopeptidase n=1 Tax=Saccharothrix tamanrassetensis TaxID=1051531 RepID=A0A841CQP2_9PSEU|nr:M48 family metalloprotease [Saccharothrix tamanrassetensis]MBB5960742.1 STE24 endopeptidase [Saccharothrix tamanrassetensis]
MTWFPPPPPPNGAVPTFRLRRGIDGSTAAILLLGLPRFLLSFLVVLTVMGHVTLPGEQLIVFGWLLSGALLFIRPVERAYAQLVIGLRKPTPSEHEQLARHWRTVAGAAGINPNRYSLFIAQDDRHNAFASAGHIVAVTSSAFKSRHPHQLEALLAHELGHHLRGHAWVKLLIRWYSWPAALAGRLVMVVAWCVRTGFLVASFVLPRYLVGAVLMPAVVVLALVFGGMFALALLAFTLADIGLMFLERAAGRIGELSSDRTAVHLGYGPALLEVLRGWLDEEGNRPSWHKRLFDTHPPLDKRVTALEKRLGTAPQPAPPVQPWPTAQMHQAPPPGQPVRFDLPPTRYGE